MSYGFVAVKVVRDCGFVAVKVVRDCDPSDKLLGGTFKDDTKTGTVGRIASDSVGAVGNIGAVGTTDASGNSRLTSLVEVDQARCSIG